MSLGRDTSSECDTHLFQVVSKLKKNDKNIEWTGREVWTDAWKDGRTDGITKTIFLHQIGGNKNSKQNKQQQSARLVHS